jgi:hypothetical protein
MSITEIEDNVVDFQQRRRQKIIRKIIQLGRFPKDQIENIIQMHEFLTTIDFAIRGGEMEEGMLEKIGDEVAVVREKFEELFEMMKQ